MVYFDAKLGKYQIEIDVHNLEYVLYYNDTRYPLEVTDAREVWYRAEIKLEYLKRLQHEPNAKT
jgi:hypothetical protein